MKRAFIPILVLATLSGIALTASPVKAQSVCGKCGDIIRQLGDKYGETRRSMGLAQGRGVVELYASQETGSWTILLTTPQGLSCLMAAGEAFQIDPLAVADKPA